MSLHGSPESQGDIPNEGKSPTPPMDRIQSAQKQHEETMRLKQEEQEEIRRTNEGLARLGQAIGDATKLELLTRHVENFPDSPVSYKIKKMFEQATKQIEDEQKGIALRSITSADALGDFDLILKVNSLLKEVEDESKE